MTDKIVTHSWDSGYFRVTPGNVLDLASAVNRTMESIIAINRKNASFLSCRQELYFRPNFDIAELISYRLVSGEGSLARNIEHYGVNVLGAAVKKLRETALDFQYTNDEVTQALGKLHPKFKAPPCLNPSESTSKLPPLASSEPMLTDIRVEGLSLDDKLNALGQYFCGPGGSIDVAKTLENMVKSVQDTEDELRSFAGKIEAAWESKSANLAIDKFADDSRKVGAIADSLARARQAVEKHAQAVTDALSAGRNLQDEISQAGKSASQNEQTEQYRHWNEKASHALNRYLETGREVVTAISYGKPVEVAPAAEDRGAHGSTGSVSPVQGRTGAGHSRPRISPSSGRGPLPGSRPLPEPSFPPTLGPGPVDQVDPSGRVPVSSVGSGSGGPLDPWASGGLAGSPGGAAGLIGGLGSGGFVGGFADRGTGDGGRSPGGRAGVGGPSAGAPPTVGRMPGGGARGADLVQPMPAASGARHGADDRERRSNPYWDRDVDLIAYRPQDRPSEPVIGEGAHGERFYGPGPV